MAAHQQETITIDGNSLTLITAMKLCNAGDAGDAGAIHPVISISAEAMDRVAECRRLVDSLRGTGKVVYGVNTGFGSLATVVIPDDKLKQLQVNLIRSHSAGIGAPIAPEIARLMMALRVNSLARGHSGVRPELLQAIVAAYNAGCVPRVPCQGTVGASGDLAPLSHMVLALMGEGEMWMDGGWVTSSTVLAMKGLAPITLESKEGLALNNGTPFMLAHLCVATSRAMRLAEAAVTTSALSFEALGATYRCLDPRISAVRQHYGQTAVAAALGAILLRNGGSEINEMYAGNKVQDGYTLRCTPQILGPAIEEILNVRDVVEIEMNSVTDNPLVFAGDAVAFVSGGNFHGMYMSNAADRLAIAVQLIATLSERRCDRLVDGHRSGMPSMLVEGSGLNNGFMIPQYAAAAITSENKVLCHPASVDTIPTCEGTEDHVSMGGFAVRKALLIVENTEKVVAIELMMACQGIGLKHIGIVKKKKKEAQKPACVSNTVVEHIYARLREITGVKMLTDDRPLGRDEEAFVRALAAPEMHDRVHAALFDSHCYRVHH